MSKQGKGVKRVIKTRTDALKVKAEVEAIFERGDAPTMKEMCALARKSGRSVPQIMRDVNIIKNAMLERKADVEEKGEFFDEREYLKDLMDEAAK